METQREITMRTNRTTWIETPGREECVGMSKAERNELRRRAFLRFSEGWSPAHVSEMIAQPYRLVCGWHQQFRTRGVEGWRDLRFRPDPALPFKGVRISVKSLPAEVRLVLRKMAFREFARGVGWRDLADDMLLSQTTAWDWYANFRLLGVDGYVEEKPGPKPRNQASARRT